MVYSIVINENIHDSHSQISPKPQTTGFVLFVDIKNLHCVLRDRQE